MATILKLRESTSLLRLFRQPVNGWVGASLLFLENQSNSLDLKASPSEFLPYVPSASEPLCGVNSWI